MRRRGEGRGGEIIFLRFKSKDLLHLLLQIRYLPFPLMQQVLEMSILFLHLVLKK
jgi:hypothetical protein